MTTPSPVFAHHDEHLRPGPTLAEVKSWPATVSVHDAARALGVSTSAAYEWIRTGEFPCRVLEVRSRKRVITASLLEVLGSDPHGPCAG